VDLDTGDRTYELQEENSGLLDKIGLTSPDLTQRDEFLEYLDENHF
jgi:hypothetical protein